MFTFFSVLDLAQDSNTKYYRSIAKKATAVSFLTSIFVYSVALLLVFPYECNEGLSAGFII
ncbi:hypothetical protein GGD38_007719 [Chitinophagaceae bacterium OAS944]|nr:hypothetical protein [Chitinophagaceae bacterium OAS944]